MLDNQIIHEFKKNIHETVRLSFGNFKGSDVISIWVFYNSDENGGGWKPSHKGISLLTTHLPELKKGIDKAYKEYQRLNNTN